MKEVDKLHSEHQHVDWTPGSRLRQVRRQAGFSKEQIAEHLHLRLSIIEAIENDRYDQYDEVEELVFIRGYLRAYASLLNLPADEIIHAFNQLELSRMEAEKLSSTLKTDRTLSSHKRNHRARSLRWIIFLVVVILMIFVLSR